MKKMIVSIILIPSFLIFSACSMESNQPVDQTVEATEPSPSSPTSTSTQIPLINLTVGTKADSHLTDEVIPLDSPERNINKVNVDIIGAEFGESSNIGNGLTDTGIGEAFTEGFLSALTRPAGDKHDAMLAIYFKLSLSKEITSPRDAVRPDFSIKITDDQGDEGNPIYNSFSADYLKINESDYGMAEFTVFSDAKSFEIDIGDNRFLITGIPFRPKDPGIN